MSDSKLLGQIGILIGLGGTGLSLAFPNERRLGWLLIAVGFGGALIAWAVQLVRHREPSRSAWLAMEQRFRQIQGELDGIWTVDEESQEIQWHVYPSSTGGDDRGGQRRKDRFITEARMAGQMVQRSALMQGTYRINEGAPAEDHWLCALGAHIDRGSSFLGSGIDNTGPRQVRTQSRPFERLVEASVHLCAQLASRGR